jgi:hypothetical protein
MRKAQVKQVFIYIITILIIGLLILFGYRAINSMIQKSCQVEMIQFKGDVESMINDNNAFGSVTNFDLVAPCDYTEICLVNANNIGDDEFTMPHSLITESVKSNISVNVFLIKKDVIMPVQPLLERLETEEDYVCRNATNKKFKFLLNGQGRTTLVK